MAIRDWASNTLSTLTCPTQEQLCIHRPGFPEAGQRELGALGRAWGSWPLLPLPGKVNKKQGQGPRSLNPNYLLVLNTSCENNLSLTYLIRLLTNIFQMWGFLLKTQAQTFSIFNKTGEANARGWGEGHDRSYRLWSPLCGSRKNPPALGAFRRNRHQWQRQRVAEGASPVLAQPSAPSRLGAAPAQRTSGLYYISG